MKLASPLPSARLRWCNQQPVLPKRDYLLYWMTAAPRPRYNFALDHAVALAKTLNKPLIVLEALRADYRWASDRIHRFVIDGMIDNHAWFATRKATYYPYLEPKPDAGKGLLKALSKRACLVVTDDFPCFFLPRMLQRAASQLDVALHAVDGNGIMPMQAAPKAFSRAYDLRRHLQRVLPHHFADMPSQNALSRATLPEIALPAAVVKRWRPADPARLRERSLCAQLPIDHSVRPAAFKGGRLAAEKRLKAFINNQLTDYHENRQDADDDGGSGLSPYLHFGHIGAHQVFRAVVEHQQWTPDRVAPNASGSRTGWWGMSTGAEAFVDQLVTWRELGFNSCRHLPHYDQYRSLPDWARTTMAMHAGDKRPYLYTLSQFEHSQTHDELWNAAQRQLVHEGRMHNYLRMLWGKKILHWSKSPQQALAIMIELNNKYAVDGRNPNSYSGIFWVLGRHDRAWGPEREVFGKIRYMTSDSTRRKLKLKRYLARYGEQSSLPLS